MKIVARARGAAEASRENRTPSPSRIESEPLRDFGFRTLRGDRQKMPAERFFNPSLTTH